MGKLTQKESDVEEQQLIYGGKAAYGSAETELDNIESNIQSITLGSNPAAVSNQWRALPCVLCSALLMSWGGFFGVMLAWDVWTPERGVPALLIVIVCFSGLAFFAYLARNGAVDRTDAGWMVEADDPNEDVSGLSSKELLARNYAHRFDNVKFIMTQFVAQHHFTMMYDVVGASIIPRVFGMWVEWFLMPTYCFMSGTLTSVQQTPARSQALFSKLLACYMVAQLLFYLLFKVVINDCIAPGAFNPIYDMTGVRYIPIYSNIRHDRF